MASNARFIVSQLRRLDLFKRLTPEQLEQIAAITQLFRAEPGTVLVQQGQAAQAMILFVSGRGILSQVAPNGQEFQMGWLAEGQPYGEDSLYSERVEAYTLRAAEAAVVMIIPKHLLAGLIVRSQEIRANIGMQQEADQPAVRLFKGQRDGETVIHIFKRHWWAFASRIWFPLLISAGLIIGGVLLLNTLSVLSMLLFAAALLIPGVISFFLYADWQDDCLIVTDQRIVKISDTLLTFEKKINEIPFERAHEINTEIPPDPFARLFGYGTVVIKTAGAAGTITIDTLSNPQQIQKLIFAQRETYRQTSSERNRSVINQTIDQALGTAGAQMHAPAPARRASESPPQQSSFSPISTRFQNANGATVYRRHISIWLRAVSVPFIVILGGFFLAIASPIIPALQPYSLIGIGVGIITLLIGGFWFYLADWDWRHDLLIVDKETVTIIHKRPLWLQNEVEQVRLAQVDNVISEVVGLVNSMLNRGTIRISLIGGDAQDAKVFSGIGDPESVQAEISERLADLQNLQQNGAFAAQQQAIAEYLSAYHQRVAGQPSYGPAPSSTMPASPYSAGQTGFAPPQSPPPPRQGQDYSRPPNVPRPRND